MTSFDKIQQAVEQYNQAVSQLPSTAQWQLLMEYNLKTIELLTHLQSDETGCALLEVLEKQLESASNTTDYIKKLHFLLVDDENNFIYQQSRKKYVLTAKAIRDYYFWIICGIVFGAIAVFAVILTLILSLIIPAPVLGAVLIPILIMTEYSLEESDRNRRQEELGSLNKSHALRTEHAKLMTDFEAWVSVDQTVIALTDEEKEKLFSKPVMFYDYSNYGNGDLHEGYHYYFDSYFQFTHAGQRVYIEIKDKKKFHTALDEIKKQHIGASRFELSVEDLKILLTDTEFESHHAVLKKLDDNNKRDKYASSPSDALLRTKQLQFFYHKNEKAIQSKVDEVTPANTAQNLLATI